MYPLEEHYVGPYKQIVRKLLIKSTDLMVMKACVWKK